MKLLIKIMVIFSTLYAVAALVRSTRIQWPFAFASTGLISLLGTIGDRLFLPKMGRVTAALLDTLLIALSLFGTGKFNNDNRRERKISLPYIGIVSGLLGGFESLFHEWLYDRERYEEPKGGTLH